jgi:hypothetical protein
MTKTFAAQARRNRISLKLGATVLSPLNVLYLAECAIPIPKIVIPFGIIELPVGGILLNTKLACGNGRY